MAEEKYTLGDLKKFLSTLTEEQLKQPVRAWDEDTCHIIHGEHIVDEPIYMDKYNDENRGTLEELKEQEGEDFKEEDFEICTSIGTIALLIEF